MKHIIINEEEQLAIRPLDIEKECPLIHSFSDNVYARTVFMPKGSIIVGKKHKTRHLNIVLSGSARVYMDGNYLDVNSPDIIESKEGCRKILYILEDMYWTTIHSTTETELDVLEANLIEETPTIDLENIIKGLVCLG